MKLAINLAVREEVAAGHALLAAILGGELSGGVTQAAHTVTETVGDISRTETKSLYQEFKDTQAASLVVPGMTITAPGIPQLDGKVIADAAAVFGGAAAPAPLIPSPPSAVLPAGNVPPPPANTAPNPANPGLASSAAPATPAGSVDLDAKGLPWDERIHSSGKTRVKGDVWRTKGGVPPERIAAVEAELRARMGNAPIAAPTATTQAPVAPVGASLPTTTALPPVAATDPETFEQLLPRITAGVTAGILPATALNAACAAQGLASIVALQAAPAYVPFVWAALKQQYPTL